jgi:hypothetical protein
MERKVELWITNLRFMSTRLREHSDRFGRIVAMLADYPEEVYSMIPENERRRLMFSFIGLDKQIRAINDKEIEKRLNTLTDKLYGTEQRNALEAFGEKIRTLLKKKGGIE